jgi:hypothetical protein
MSELKQEKHAAGLNHSYEMIRGQCDMRYEYTKAYWNDPTGFSIDTLPCSFRGAVASSVSALQYIKMYVARVIPDGV